MRLLSWNVNGIRAACKKGFLDWLKKDQPEVLCLQETKCEADQVPAELASHPGYFGEWHWSTVKRGYCGVSTMTRGAGFTAVERGIGHEAFDGEGRVLATRLSDITLLNVYFPNGKARPERLKFKMDFNEEFLRLIDRLRRRGQDKLVICGDVNTAHKELDLARPKENSKTSGFLPEERAWIDKLLAAGFVDTFREFNREGGQYSWWDQMTRARERNVGWRIDYFFVSANLRPRLKGAFILPQVMGSDHCPVGIELQ